jgi:hypothetical protein
LDGNSGLRRGINGPIVGRFLDFTTTTTATFRLFAAPGTEGCYRVHYTAVSGPLLADYWPSTAEAYSITVKDNATRPLPVSDTS